MSWITTFTGKHFDPMLPEPEKLDVTDIAHSLSLLCRGNGHVKTFFSVAQHCINCANEAIARGYSDRIILACLIHDASEAYMADIPRPVKQELPEYKASENKLIDVIYQHFLGSILSNEEEKMVKGIDDAMMYYDLTYLLNERPEGDVPQIKIQLSYDVVPFEAVENKYKEIFYRYWK